MKEMDNFVSVNKTQTVLVRADYIHRDSSVQPNTSRQLTETSVVSAFILGLCIRLL